MGTTHGRPAARPPPPSQPRAMTRPRVDCTRDQVAQPRPFKPPAAAVVDEDAAACALFSACARRDNWLSAIVTAVNDEPWLAERSKSSQKYIQTSVGSSGSLDKLAIHRSGSSVVAVIVGSTQAQVGDVLWTVDARERTVTSFGQPGWGGRLLGQPCVLLVDESAGGRIVLYFYSGHVCLLRCWRRHATCSGSATASTQQQQQQPPQKQQPQQRRREQRSRPAHVEPQHVCRRHASRSGEGQRHAPPRSQPTTGRAPPADAAEQRATTSRSDAGAHMAAWAAGKDLAALLADARSTYASALPVVLDWPPTDAATLRGQPALLKKAYHRALLACHPDKHVSSPPERRAVAVALFHAISGARAAAAAVEAGCAMAC